ncbi:MAG: hypothetical protein M1834_004965 [Cirrosporium novae-zelandiae]|nr:MAG: hypothetical protein M1834_004965 [Cirrosporium novae-zelandiae]
MYSNRGRKRGRGNGRPSHSKTPLKKGLFMDGVWYCNCEPRLLATKFQVKKMGKNLGKWFYACQKPIGNENRCDYFLFDDDAKCREKTNVLENTRSESSNHKPEVQEAAPPPPPTPTLVRRPSLRQTFLTPFSIKKKTGREMMKEDEVQIQSDDDDNGATTPSPTPSPPPETNKPKKRRLFTSTSDNEEESYDWPKSDDDMLAAVADCVEMPPPETPRKVRKTDAFASPGQRSRAILATPSTSGDRQFYTPLSKKVDSVHLRSRGTEPKTGLISPAYTPTPSRFKDARLHSPASKTAAPSPSPPSDITKEIMNLLEAKHAFLLPSAEEALKNTLNKYSMKMEGVIRGREAARNALKEREAKIGGLVIQVSRLERERERLNGVVEGLKKEQDGER